MAPRAKGKPMVESTATRCPTCDAAQTQTWTRRSWFMTGLATFIVGLLLFWVVLPPIGPMALVAGAALMIASPWLPTKSRCESCRT